MLCFEISVQRYSSEYEWFPVTGDQPGRPRPGSGYSWRKLSVYSLRKHMGGRVDIGVEGWMSLKHLGISVGTSCNLLTKGEGRVQDIITNLNTLGPTYFYYDYELTLCYLKFNNRR